MSSSAQGGPSAPKEKKGSGSRMLTRVKTFIKKRAEKRLSISGTSKSAAAPGPEPIVASVVAEPAAAAAEPAVVADPAVADESKGKKAKEVEAKPEKIPRIQLHEERARKLGERFGLAIEPNEWHSTEGDALRVIKPIRMRVHRTCHQCNTQFGLSKECTNCKHVRCKKCARYPPKRSEAEKLASRDRRAALIKEQKESAPAYIVPDWDPKPKAAPLVKPARKHNQDLVYKKPRQRLRRNCCQCDKLFVAKTKVCEGCSHVRCTDCPRNPSKKDKYPYGYPGDEFGAKSIPRFRCHVCKNKFPADAADGVECAKCAHPKCSDCPRLLPQRVDPDLDPDILKSIEAKLSKLKVG